MEIEEFRQHAHQLVDWIAAYFTEIEKYPVRAQVHPREIYNQLPDTAPQESEDFEDIFRDFREIIMPGITHWQHPAFYAYFPANSSFPSILAEMLTAALGQQGMIWETSPAATELEERVMNWLKTAMGLPQTWTGVIQDTASTATLCALLTARELATDFTINQKGFVDAPRFKIYASAQTHSSIEKAVKIAGFGREAVRYITTDAQFAMIPEALQTAITADRAEGYTPLAVVATLGTTSSTAFDPLESVGAICRSENIFLHVDAAFAGSASILPEKQYLFSGLEYADSYVFNPHKWLFTNFDCTAYFVRDKGALIRTFEILPEYLKTAHDTQVNNHRDWGIQLGRRFRALKLWFVLRHYGLEGIRARLREHLALADTLATTLQQHPDFEILAPITLNLVCFRYHPQHISDEMILESLNAKLLSHLNDSGKAYLTHTKLNGRYTLRWVIGQTNVQERHITNTWQQIQEIISTL